VTSRMIDVVVAVSESAWLRHGLQKKSLKPSSNITRRERSAAN
jgi:hypothetical protein